MSNEEVNKLLDELHEVRPEKLNNKAKKLFEAIMKIADDRDKAESDLYEANNRINDLLDIVKQKDRIIDEMEKEAYKFGYNNGCNDTSKFNDKNFIRVDKLKEIIYGDYEDLEIILMIKRLIDKEE